MSPLCLAYYCSGHGYGHATRVSAFACHLLSLPPEERPTVYISSSAPKHIFLDSIALGALYRYAEIDPIIVQPLAYRVDRQKSIDVLKLFLDKKDTLLDAELQWLRDIKAHAILSDAAFLGCLAAKAAGIPSILITNFTFDSVYSYLATPLFDDPFLHKTKDYIPASLSPLTDLEGLVADTPILLSELEPLVEQIFAGYRCADMLFLLPGCIPIPSFSIYPSLPSPDWVDASSNTFHPTVTEILYQKPSSYSLHPGVPFPCARVIKRHIVPAPLVVRQPTAYPSVYSLHGRSRLLSSIGVPVEFHDPARTKILVVSFGGQVFRVPSHSRSRSRSRSPTPSTFPSKVNGSGSRDVTIEMHLPHLIQKHSQNPCSKRSTSPGINGDHETRSPLATHSHILVPGAPPASKHSLILEFHIPELVAIPSTPDGATDSFDLSNGLDGSEADAQLLPDSSWIAIICGVLGEQRGTQGNDQDSGLPDGFFVAPRDVYMPDLTAVGDVLLGKLGYGTVSECIDSCTPFVYVPRPLFIEEHGLRLLLDREGTGVELSRQSYEAGDWATAVSEAWDQGKASKIRKRLNAAAGIGTDIRKREGVDMAKKVVHRVKDWWDNDGFDSSNTVI